jgi:hypothetical protein
MVQCDQKVRREGSGKGKEISCSRNVTFLDSNVKRSMSTRIGFEGITAMTNQEFHNLQNIIVVNEAPQRNVEHRISVASVRESVCSIFDHELDHGCRPPTPFVTVQCHK